MAEHAARFIDLLFASMFRDRHPNRRRSSFAFNIPGQPLLFGGGGVSEINYDNKLLLVASLYIRKHGSSHLNSMSISEIESSLLDFITKNYYRIAKECFGNFFSGSYSENLSESAKNSLVDAILVSEFFVRPHQTVLFPLIPVTVDSGFSSKPFFLGSPAELSSQIEISPVPGTLIPDSFPPIKDWQGVRHILTSWLGVRSPTLGAAKQMRAVILGAVALLPHHLERYMFSGRSMFGGYTSFQRVWSLSIGEPHTPALMTNLVIDDCDHPWLQLLADKIISERIIDRRHLRALEYYYRAWTPDPVKRFPTLFAALDAIFGDASQATQAVVDAINPIMGSQYTHSRIRLMLGLRASVIHGGAPNVYESSKYGMYYEFYETDPIHDLELIVARCLQSVIFGAILNERPHSYADLIKKEMGVDV